MAADQLPQPLRPGVEQGPIADDITHGLLDREGGIGRRLTGASADLIGLGIAVGLAALGQVCFGGPGPLGERRDDEGKR